MFSKNSFTTDIVLGERYRDEQTGIEGVATVVSFYQHACERVNIECVIDRKIEDYGFDAPRLTHIESGQTAKAEKTGGPERGVSHARPGAVSR